MYTEKIRKFIGHCWVHEMGGDLAEGLIRGKSVNSYNIPHYKHSLNTSTDKIPDWLVSMYIAASLSKTVRSNTDIP
jgi:hypothetical protein